MNMKDENRSSIGEKMKISDGEKLIMLMLCELNDKIEQNSIKDDFIDFKFIKTAILKNSEWSLFYKFKGLNLQAPTEIEVKEVIGVLEMWDMIEISYTKLSYYDKIIVDKEAYCKPIFTGFGDIREDKYIKIAEYFIHELGYYTVFKNRDFSNSYYGMSIYRKMLDYYLSIKNTVIYNCRILKVEEIIKLLNI